MKIDFGRYEGKDISELTIEYIDTLLAHRYAYPELSGEILEAIKSRRDEIRSLKSYKDNEAHKRNRVTEHLSRELFSLKS